MFDSPSPKTLFCILFTKLVQKGAFHTKMGLAMFSVRNENAIPAIFCVHENLIAYMNMETF